MYQSFGFGFLCPFRSVTGLLCPGCGVSHMLVCLAHFDFSGAWESNPVLVFSFLPIVYFIIKNWLAWLDDDVLSLNGIETALLWIIIAALCIYFILRNRLLPDDIRTNLEYMFQCDLTDIPGALPVEE
jgi:hypothetical protein